MCADFLFLSVLSLMSLESLKGVKKLLRRRIFAYLVLYASGIAAGCLFFECNKYFVSIFLLISVVLIVRYIDVEYIPEETNKEKLILIIIMLVGFMLFTLNYINMNRPLLDNNHDVINEHEIKSIEGKVISYKEKNDGCQLVVNPTSIEGSGKIIVTNKQIFDEDILGSEIKCYGTLDKPSSAENPGCFNYKIYLNGKGISHSFYAERIKIKGNTNALIWNYKRSVSKLKNRFLNQFKNSKNRAFIKGAIFGDKSDIDKETLEEFNTNSTGHILAVSGLHVGFLFTLLKIISRRRKTKVITGVIILILLMYGEMTGWSTSTVRAVLVLSLSMLSIYFRRPNDLLSLVSTAGIIILTNNPYQLFNSGFQMSFIALTGIAFLTKPLSYFLGDYLAGLLSIQIAILPLIGFYYSGINILSCLINIPIVFLASILVPACILGVGILLAMGFVPDFYIAFLNLISNLVIKTNDILSFNKFFYYNVLGVNAGLLVGLYIILFFTSSEWMRIKMLRKDRASIRRVMSLILIPIVLVSIGTRNNFINDDVVFVSVGQGDCTHIRADGHDVLIDGGGDRNYNVGEKILKPYLLKNGAKNIDVAVATHLHMDHYKGLEELSETFTIGKILIPSEGINYGNKIMLSKKVYVESVWPLDRNAQVYSSENENENNMVYIIYCGDKKILITGDMLEKDEIEMVNYYRGTDKLDCDVLKVGHHGSRSSTTEELINAVTPHVAVISVGKNNVYGHPHQETLDILNEHGIITYRTDINGAVGIEFRAKKIVIDTMKL